MTHETTELRGGIAAEYMQVMKEVELWIRRNG